MQRADRQHDAFCDFTELVCAGREDAWGALDPDRGPDPRDDPPFRDGAERWHGLRAADPKKPTPL